MVLFSCANCTLVLRGRVRTFQMGVLHSCVLGARCTRGSEMGGEFEIVFSSLEEMSCSLSARGFEKSSFSFRLSSQIVFPQLEDSNCAPSTWYHRSCSARVFKPSSLRSLIQTVLSPLEYLNCHLLARVSESSPHHLSIRIVST